MEPLSCSRGSIISSIWQFFFSLHFTTSILVMMSYHKSIPSNDSERSVWYMQRMYQRLFFENEPISKERTYKFLPDDNEGTFRLLLPSDHFINPTVWYLVLGLNFMTSIMVMITYHKDI